MNQFEIYLKEDFLPLYLKANYEAIMQGNQRNTPVESHATGSAAKSNAVAASESKGPRVGNDQQ